MDQLSENIQNIITEKLAVSNTFRKSCLEANYKEEDN